MLDTKRLCPVLAALVAAAVGTAAPAHAQGAYDEATAEQLFQQGMDAMKKGDYATACPLIERTVALDPGMAARFRLAECYDKQGKTARAWRLYQQVEQEAEAAGSAPQMAERAKLARERVAEIAPRLTKLRLVVPESVATLPGMGLTRNGEPVGKEQWGQAVAVDPGDFRISAAAAGYQPWSTQLKVEGAGETATLQIPTLTSIAPLPPPPPPPPDEGGLGAQTIAGIVVGAGGVVMAGVGGILGLVAKSQYDGAEGHCGDTGGCDPAGFETRRDARRLGDAGSVVMGIGGALVVAGVVVWLTAPSGSSGGDKATATLGLGGTTVPGGGSLTIGGRF